MAETSLMIDAAPDAVFAVLANGWTYGQWVVGTSHVRAVDPRWPEAGSELHHAVGVWPFVVRDRSEVRDCRPGQRLQLIAHGWPLGAAEVDITLEPAGGGTRVTMREEPVGGPGVILRNPLGDAFIHRRNIETLHRLAAIAESRTEPAEGR